MLAHLMQFEMLQGALHVNWFHVAPFEKQNNVRRIDPYFDAFRKIVPSENIKSALLQCNQTDRTMFCFVALCSNPQSINL